MPATGASPAPPPPPRPAARPPPADAAAASAAAAAAIEAAASPPRVSASERFNSRLRAEASKMDRAQPASPPPPRAREAWGGEALEAASEDEDESEYIMELHRLRARAKAAETHGRALVDSVQ